MMHADWDFIHSSAGCWKFVPWAFCRAVASRSFLYSSEERLWAFFWYSWVFLVKVTLIAALLFPLACGYTGVTVGDVKKNREKGENREGDSFDVLISPAPCKSTHFSLLCPYLIPLFVHAQAEWQTSRATQKRKKFIFLFFFL